MPVPFGMYRLMLLGVFLDDANKCVGSQPLARRLDQTFGERACDAGDPLDQGGDLILMFP
jgi:hypothetical protein